MTQSRQSASSARRPARNFRRGVTTTLPGCEETDPRRWADIFLFAGFRFDRAGGFLFRTNGSNVADLVALGSRALALLGLLVERQGQLVTKDEIFGVVWRGSPSRRPTSQCRSLHCAGSLTAIGIRALHEATFFAGLRKGGMPEE
jgi:hypothetical protein